MNGILYLLIGGCVAGVIALAFFQQQAHERALRLVVFDHQCS
jgi:O-acetyl-ADP-ribose deacetylase (regulator of RNase III)